MARIQSRRDLPDRAAIAERRAISHRSSGDELLVSPPHGNTSCWKYCTSFVNPGLRFVDTGLADAKLAAQIGDRHASLPPSKLRRSALVLVVGQNDFQLD